VAAVAAPAPSAKPAKAAKAAKPSKSDRKRSPAKGGRALPATRMIVLQPPELAGATYGLGDELTVGRATGCKVSLPNDSYASNLHARAYQADGLTFVEDLGSTNGTFVNGERISAPTALKVGDRVQVGATVLELE
jgi:pSer/pThr/pTyr-binding forkhead associated (FHA) protein